MGRVRSDSASHCWISGHCCQNPPPGWAGSGAAEGRETRDTADRPGLKQVRPLPPEERGSAAGSPAHAHGTQPREGLGEAISPRSRCSMNKDGDLSLVPRHGHPGLCPSHRPELTSAAAVAIARVKGRFYDSHRRANALIQRGRTVPSGQRREDGRNVPSACWNGFKADFTPRVGSTGEQGRTEPGWQELPGRSGKGQVLWGARCPGQGWGEQRKLPSPSSSSSSSSPPSSSSSSTSLSASCSPFSSFSLARQNIT